MPRLRTILAGFTVVVVCAAAGLFISAAVRPGSNDDGPRPPAVDVPVATPAVALSTSRAPRLTRLSSIVATAHVARLGVYARRAGHKPERILRPRANDGHRLPLVMLVTRHEGGWLRVRLPTRPNGAVGWIRRSAVNVAVTDYRVVVALSEHRLYAWRGKTLIAHQQIAVGKALSPTPTGRYFLADLIKAKDPAGFYGPYAFGLSAYSSVYTSFGSGDGQIGIHGTSQPSVIGTDVSHGCIRLSNHAITKLARMLPLGTPVRIAA